MFNQFKLRYNMNKLDLIPMELMHELDSVEESLVKPHSVHISDVSSVNPKEKPKGGNKNKNKKNKVQVPVAKTTATKK